MKALVVDDDPDVLSFLVGCIETASCDEVDTAENGEEALARAVQARYDLVTLDIQMPGVSGLDILSVIRGMMPWAVIAIISGYTEDVPDMARDYADLVIAKPVRVPALIKVVQAARELKEKRESLKTLIEE